MKFRAAAVALALCASTFIQPASASYNGVIDYSNMRIVPIFHRSTGADHMYSGYIYSSRIIFSAGHSEVRFSKDGTRLPFTPLPAYVGLPNSKVTNDLKRYPVIKRILSPTIREQFGLFGDFVIYVLGEDIGDFKPAKLATLEIQKELEAARASVEITGYGEYKDRCEEGEKLPCSQKPNSRSLEPRKLKVEVRPYEDFFLLNGYERPQLKESLLLWGGVKGTACSGDSGGSVSMTYKGEEMYLAVTPNGMNAYSCGASDYFDGKGGMMYSSPIYDHLDILKEAEDFVMAEKAKEALAKATPVKKKSTIACTKGKTSRKVTAFSPKCPAGYKKK